MIARFISRLSAISCLVASASAPLLFACPRITCRLARGVLGAQHAILLRIVRSASVCECPALEPLHRKARQVPERDIRKFMVNYTGLLCAALLIEFIDLRVYISQ